MNPKIGAAVVLSLALAGSWTAAWAQDPAASEELSSPIEPGAPTMQPQATPEGPRIVADEHGTLYVSGGVSLEERDQLREMARGFPLRITSARPDAALVPNVAVAISDARGRQVLAVPEAGPLLYVNLPPGNYRISVIKDGQVESRKVTITGGQQREAAFFWPAGAS